MIAIDTNILVNVHRTDAVFHKKADFSFTKLVESGSPWAIAWPCIHEFLAVVTNSRIYKAPTPINLALKEIEAWFECPNFQLLGETTHFWPIYKEAIREGKMTGINIHDAKIYSIYKTHQVAEIWSADTDFLRMKGIKVVNPLLSPLD